MKESKLHEMDHPDISAQFISNHFNAPGWNDRGHIAFVLSVFLLSILIFAIIF